MKVLVIDQANMVHRARAGFDRGPHSITYTYLLMLRKTISLIKPDKVYIVKEGKPIARKETFSGYKSGRSSPGDDFWRQFDDILRILDTFPVTIIRHPLREADDTIAYIVNKIHFEDECVVSSTDTDFIQLLRHGDDRVKLWNPKKEVYVEAPLYDYVKWKSIVGDSSDAIPGFKGIGAKTAEKMLMHPDKLQEFLSRDGNMEKYDRNFYLISFHGIEDQENLEISGPKTNWDSVRSLFEERNFKSLLKDKPWNRFVSTFENLQ